MLNKEENDLLTRTGPGTPMGTLMRRYWVPALLSWEVAEPDSPPVRVQLLGERLLAFRDTNGAVGLVDELCAHRRAPLFFGRNEECGLRCIYHGWKYDVSGACVDQPNEPPDKQFKDKIQLKAYPTVEIGGLIWAYMGPPEKQPALPTWEFTQVPTANRHLTKTWEECNWLQGFEGGIDTVHVSFLHHGMAEKARGKLAPDDPLYFREKYTTPDLDVEQTPYGFRYASIRQMGDRGSYVRAYTLVMPWSQVRPNQARPGRRTENDEPVWRDIIAGHFWVPMDDENVMVWNWFYSYGEPLTPEDDFRDDDGPEHVDYANGFRKRRNRDHDYNVDRELQRTKSYTGIGGTNTQDHAVQEGMGAIVDRSQEHLGSTDKAVIAGRRLLLQALKTVEAGGDPPGLTADTYRLRAIEDVLPDGNRWREELLPRMLVPDPAPWKDGRANGQEADGGAQLAEAGAGHAGR
jgi:phenylpropionate dioxygenase-like ring-hydroxylating dioxygenase large terminal subunit